MTSKPGETNAQPAPTFTAQTIVNSLPDSIQIIVPFAPQVSFVVVLTLEQVRDALARSIQMRTQQPEEIRNLLRSKRLHA